MQVTETSSDGLKRELKVVAQDELSERFTTRLDEVKEPGPAQGFPQGQGAAGAPQEAVRPLGDGRGGAAGRGGDEPQGRQGSQRAAAHQPNINFTEDKEEIEKVLAGRAISPSR